MTRPDSLRVGIIGIGFGQNVLLPAFRMDPRVSVEAICASTLERAQAIAVRAAVPAAFGDWRELLAGDLVDAVAIAVPPRLQPAIASAAMAGRKHVFCEKPVACDLARARELLGQAKEARVAHAVDFEFGELASWRRAKQVLAAGELGAIRSFTLTWHVETRAQRLQSDSWKQRTDDGGGALASFASHSLYLVEWLLGPLVRLTAQLTPPDAAADARVRVLCELSGGVSGVISVATDAVAGSGHHIEICGSEGSLLLENRSTDHLRNFVLSLGRRSQPSEVLLDERRTGDPGSGGSDGRIEPVAALVRRFVDAALGGAAMQPNLADGVRVEVLMDAIRSSSRSGTWSQL